MNETLHIESHVIVRLALYDYMKAYPHFNIYPVRDEVLRAFVKKVTLIGSIEHEAELLEKGNFAESILPLKERENIIRCLSRIERRMRQSSYGVDVSFLEEMFPRIGFVSSSPEPVPESFIEDGVDSIS